jgi:hypothetical protein
MELMLGLIVVGLGIPLLIAWEQHNRRISQLIDHVATTLYREILAPIESKCYKDRTMILDDAVAKNLIEYVDTANRFLKAFYQARWDNKSEDEKSAWNIITENSNEKALKSAWKVIGKAQRQREKSLEYRLFQRMEKRFVWDKTFSLTGQDLYDSFGYWAWTLFQHVNAGSIELSEIKAIHICDHGEIAFATNSTFVGLKKDTRQFKCNNCTSAAHILRPPDESVNPFESLVSEGTDNRRT